MKSTREIFPDFKDDSISYYDREMLADKQHTDLFQLHSSILQCNPKNTIIQHNNTEGRENTLTFLHQLLSDGKIKIGFYKGGPGVAEEYTGTPDEIIDRIRTEWNDTSETGGKLHPMAYEISVHITLAENPWPVWK